MDQREPNCLYFIHCIFFSDYSLSTCFLSTFLEKSSGLLYMLHSKHAKHSSNHCIGLAVINIVSNFWDPAAVLNKLLNIMIKWIKCEVVPKFNNEWAVMNWSAIIWNGNVQFCDYGFECCKLIVIDGTHSSSTVNKL